MLTDYNENMILMAAILLFAILVILVVGLTIWKWPQFMRSIRKMLNALNNIVKGGNKISDRSIESLYFQRLGGIFKILLRLLAWLKLTRYVCTCNITVYTKLKGGLILLDSNVISIKIIKWRSYSQFQDTNISLIQLYLTKLGIFSFTLNIMMPATYRGLGKCIQSLSQFIGLRGDHFVRVEVINIFLGGREERRVPEKIAEKINVYSALNSRQNEHMGHYFTPFMSLYREVTRYRNRTVIESNYNKEAIIYPDILLYELIDVKKDFDSFDLNITEINIVTQWKQVVLQKKFKDLTLFRQYLTKSFLAKITMVWVLVYIGYFGILVSSGATVVSDDLLATINMLNKEINIRGIENLNSLKNITGKLSTLREETKSCKRCGSIEKAEWMKLLNKFVKEFEAYSIKEIFPKLSYMAHNNIGSSLLARDFYLHFKLQSTYLKKDDQKKGILNKVYLGDLVDVNGTVQKTINKAYLLYLKIIKEDFSLEQKHPLGRSIVRDLSKNKWFIYWYMNYISNRSNSNNKKDSAENIDLKSANINVGTKENEISQRISVKESSWYYSPEMAKWILALLLEIEPITYENDDLSLVSSYIDNYMIYWFKCEENWKEQDQVHISLSVCRLPLGKSIAESIGISQEVISPIERYKSLVESDYIKDISMISMLSSLNKASVIIEHLNFGKLVQHTKKTVFEESDKQRQMKIIATYEQLKKSERQLRQGSNWLSIYKLLLETGENSELIKIYLPILQELENGEINNSSKIVEFIFKRQLYANLLQIRKNIVEELNKQWRAWTKKLPDEKGNLRSKMSSNEKLITNISFVNDYSKIKQIRALTFTKFISPNLAFYFNEFKARANKIKQLVEIDTLPIYSEPSESRTGETILGSSLEVKCGKERSLITNKNYRQVFDLKINYPSCDALDIKVRLVNSLCKKTINGNYWVISSLNQLLSQGESINLACDNDQNIYVDIGFRTNTSILSDINNYITYDVPNMVAY